MIAAASRRSARVRVRGIDTVLSAAIRATGLHTADCLESRAMTAEARMLLPGGQRRESTTSSEDLSLQLKDWSSAPNSADTRNDILI